MVEDRYIILKIELIINKLLYRDGIIDKRSYEQTTKKIEKLLLEEEKKVVLF